ADLVGLHRVVVELDLGDGGAGAADVARGGVDQEVLAGGVVPPGLGDGRPGDEGVPGEVVDVLVVRPPGVAAGDGDVVASVGHQGVDQHALGDGGLDVLLDSVAYGVGRAGVAARGTDVRLEDAH